MVKEGTYVHIEAFMINDLHLKGNELLVYAIIYGFSMDGKSRFSGSLQYLADWTNSSKRGVLKVLQKLVSKGLIEKTDVVRHNVKYCLYSIKPEGGEQSSLGYGTEFTGGGEQSSPNTIINTIDDTIERQTATDVATEKPSPEKVFEYYHEKKLAVSPQRFWKYNNNRKWRDKNGKRIKDWKKAYLQMCDSFTVDEEYDRKLAFKESEYDYYQT